MNRMEKKFFTLIELLIVIAIIAILAGMLLPALNKARQKAQTIQCISNLSQMGKAIVMYQMDYQEYLPCGYTGEGSPERRWFREIFPYVGSAKVYSCPTNKVPAFWENVTTGIPYSGHYGSNMLIGRADIYFPMRKIPIGRRHLIMLVGDIYRQVSAVGLNMVPLPLTTTSSNYLDPHHNGQVCYVMSDGRTVSRTTFDIKREILKAAIVNGNTSNDSVMFQEWLAGFANGK